MEYQDIWQEFQPLPSDTQALVADFISTQSSHNKLQSQAAQMGRIGDQISSLVFGKTEKICKI